MRMKVNNVVVAYWADTELAFVEFARRLCGVGNFKFSLFRISHEKTWFTPRRSLFANFLHLGKIFSRIIFLGVNGCVVSFGTNTCRILFFFSWLFRDIHYIYNELPSFSNRSPVAWIDRLIFKFARNVRVSTPERAEFVVERYELGRSIGVLENISFTAIPDLDLSQRDSRVIFAGSVTAKRFSDNDVEKMACVVNRVGCPVDVYGEVVGEISPGYVTLINLKGKVPHARMLEIIRCYEYGLLSYYTDEPNYDLCAPLKLYEYIAYGCKVISLNRNKGLVELAARYPVLISFASRGDSDDLMFGSAEYDEFVEQREQFLENAISSNRQFAEGLVFSRGE